MDVPSAIRLRGTGHDKAAAIAVALFLFFDFSMLALNVWMSWRIEREAIAINLAGRQRMLSQRMAKVLFQLEDVQDAEQERRPARADGDTLLRELESTRKLFDSTLLGFDAGGMTRDGGGRPLRLEPLDDAAAQRLVDRAMATWTPYRDAVEALLAAGPADRAQRLASAASIARAHNLDLLDTMNELTSRLERIARAEAARIRLFQGGAFLLALANFLLVFVLYGRRIRDARRRQDLLDEILDKVPASVLVVDAASGAVLRVNQLSLRLFGYAEEELLGRPIGGLLVASDGRVSARRKDGSSFIAHIERNEGYLEGRKLLIVSVRDVTEQHRLEEQLSGLAYHDPLTGLPNRLLFEDRLRVAIARSGRAGLKLAVMFVDLDRFKPVNDTWGHAVGDTVLREVAKRLAHAVRDSDTVARRSGDEFTLIVSDLASREDCARIAAHVVEALGAPIEAEGHRVQVGASVGIALYPEDADTPQRLEQAADEAMYLAKQAGGGSYRFHEAGAPQRAAGG